MFLVATMWGVAIGIRWAEDRGVINMLMASYSSRHRYLSKPKQPPSWEILDEGAVFNLLRDAQWPREKGHKKSGIAHFLSRCHVLGAARDFSEVSQMEMSLYRFTEQEIKSQKEKQQPSK